ncbi:unnamed protein product [Spirodela intermedia]|uniref:IBH1-like N-terminal domain-containing protein n=1 Tax=Spirodela intermedia TaxID=51605 RepID=A0A7I8IPJ8_SPIIN|nr:unnamed protein product [Spirodela intermedia]CAA6659828.1 unnamed protein product [Spirodela intermedia]
MHREALAGNPNPSRHLQALHFLGALARINKLRARKSPPSRRATALGGRRITRAAYAAMAVAAGPRRAWSRAILLGLRRNSIAKPFLIKKRILKPHRELRDVGSRAEEMEFGSLLDETLNYIHHLTAQVGIMQKIADSLCK